MTKSSKTQKPERIDPKKIDRKKKVKYKRFFLKNFQLHANIGGYITGTVIPLRCDKKTGLPVIRYWRSRLKDAVKDGCITVY